jgi:hypothetical protein
MSTTSEAPVGALHGPCYYRSFASYAIPFRPEGALEFADTEGLRSFYVVFYDPVGRVTRFDKRQLVRVDDEPREVQLATHAEPGARLYFEPVQRRNARSVDVGNQCEYRDTEHLKDFFVGKVGPSGQTDVVLFRRDVAFAEAYEYWPNGHLRKRVMTGPDQPPSVALYDQEGCPIQEAPPIQESRPVLASVPEPEAPTCVHIEATGGWVPLVAADPDLPVFLLYRVTNRGPSSVTLRSPALRRRERSFPASSRRVGSQELLLSAGNSVDLGACVIECRVDPDSEGGALIEYRLLAPPQPEERPVRQRR